MTVILKLACKFGANDALKNESILMQAARALGDTTGTSAMKKYSN